MLTAIIPRAMPWARSFWAFSPYLNHMRKFCCLFIKVLSFLLSLVPKLDGVMRTMVIAGEAGEAILVVQPFRIGSMPSLDIAYRTDIGTDATLHAAVFLNTEPLVGDEHFLEESTHYLGEEPRNRTFYEPVYALFAIENLFADYRQFLCSLFLLPDFTLLWVYIHKRKSHV